MRREIIDVAVVEDEGVNKGGRPSKYNDELQEKFDDLVDRWEVRDYFKYGDVNQIALFLGIHRDTVYDWNVKFERFSDTLKRWKTKQRAFLFELAPAISVKNASLWIFLAKVKLNYAEINKHELTGKDGGAISFEEKINKMSDEELETEIASRLNSILGSRKN